MRILQKFPYIDYIKSKNFDRIEVEGPPHFLRASQILKDFERDDYSTDDGFETFRVPNHYINEHFLIWSVRY